MIKFRFYKVILLLPLIFSLFFFFQFKHNYEQSKKINKFSHNLYKYPKDLIKVSYLPMLKEANIKPKYLLEVSTCIPKSEFANCVIIKSETIFSELGNCEDLGEDIFRDTFDLEKLGIRLGYICHKVEPDAFV